MKKTYFGKRLQFTMKQLLQVVTERGKKAVEEIPLLRLNRYCDCVRDAGTAYFDKPTFVKLFKDAVRRQGSRRGRPRPKKLRNLTELVQHEFLACLNVARVYGWEKGLLFNDPEYLRLRRWHPDKASVGDGGNGSENGDVAQMALDTLVAGLESGELSVVQAS